SDPRVQPGIPLPRGIGFSALRRQQAASSAGTNLAPILEENDGPDRGVGLASGSGIGGGIRHPRSGHGGQGARSVLRVYAARGFQDGGLGAVAFSEYDQVIAQHRGGRRGRGCDQNIRSGRDEIGQYGSGLYRWQLIHVAEEDQGGSFGQGIEKPGQCENVHHGNLVYDEQVGGKGALPAVEVFPRRGVVAEQAMQGLAFQCRQGPIQDGLAGVGGGIGYAFEATAQRLGKALGGPSGGR